MTTPVLQAPLILRMPFQTPPLRSNDRDPHWAVKARKTRDTRNTARVIARDSGRWRPTQRITGPVTITLIWEVTDRRVRDAGSGSPTLKACLDGIVDAGVLTRDDHTVVVEERCRIEAATLPGVRIEIHPTQDTP